MTNATHHLPTPPHRHHPRANSHAYTRIPSCITGSLLVAILIALAFTTAAAAQNNEAVWTDPRGDAVVRRTGQEGPLHPQTRLPDLLEVRLAGWSPTNPVADPYTGTVIRPRDAHLVRIQIVFGGLINPPGTLGVAGQPYDPFRFGVSPVFGFLDIDIDDQKNTGGELGAPAIQRYLANVGRFGHAPYGSIGERIATSAFDYDMIFSTDPQYERTGAEFALVFCGCWATTIVQEGGNGNGLFERGETWIVRGRFFQRAQSFAPASGAFGGSAPGQYDPWVNLRFSHSLTSDTTTITLVYPLTMQGAAMLTGQPAQQPDFNVANHTSIYEALLDFIPRAGSQSGPLDELIRGWRGRDAEDYLDPTDWHITALFGTAHMTPQDSLYVWTDAGFYETPGDMNSDGFADELDADMLRERVYRLDGSPRDADGIVNGVVVLPNRSRNFDLFDLNGDGVISAEDLWTYGHRADIDGNGRLDIFDFLLFQNLWVMRDPIADFNLDQVFDIFDFLEFSNAFVR